MSNSTRQRLGGLTLTVVLVVSVFAGAAMPAAAAGNADHDDETTVTSATSDIVAGTTVGNVGTDSTDNHTVARVIADTNDSKYVIEDADSGFEAYSNDSLAFEGENTSHQFLSANITESQLLDLEHSPGENVTVDSIVYNTTNVSEADAVNDTVTAYVEFDNSTGTETLTDGEVADGDVVEVTEESGPLGVSILETDKTRVEKEDAEIPNDTYYVAAANSSVADDYTTALGEFDTESKMSGVLSAFGPNTLVKVSDGDTTKFIPVYADSAPDDAPDTYAVVEDVGGTDAIAIYGLAEADGWDQGDTVDITAASGTGTDGFFFGYMTNSLPSFSFGMIDFDGIVGAGAGGIISLGIGAAAVRRRVM